MKKLLSIFFFFIVINISHSSIAQVNIDSLWSVWEDTSQEDTIRLNCINSVIRKVYLFTQPDTAFQLAQLQYDFAELKNNKK